MRRQRVTPQRRRVLALVKAQREHLCADQIYLLARDESPHISRGTVYRNLHLLVENGEIGRAELPGLDRFDGRTDPHYHLLCRRCGKVIDAPLPYDAEADARVAAETGFSIERHTAVFEGLCPECRAKKEEKEE